MIETCKKVERERRESRGQREQNVSFARREERECDYPLFIVWLESRLENRRDLERARTDHVREVTPSRRWNGEREDYEGRKWGEEGEGEERERRVEKCVPSSPLIVP